MRSQFSPLLGAAVLLSLLSCWPAAGDSVIKQSDVFRSGSGGYHTYRIPAIVRAEDGALVAICEGRRRSRGDSGDIDLLCRRSADGGKSWSESHLIWDDGRNTCGNPCPVVDRSTGVIWLLMTHNLGHDNESEIKRGTSESTRTVWVCRSEDHGRTWSAPVEITQAVKKPHWTWYATGPGGGIQLRSAAFEGRLVIPCDHIDTQERMYSHVIYSDDHGQTWRLGGTATNDGVNECEVAELSDGRLMLNMRNYDRATPARQIAESDDGGITWRDQRHDLHLIEPRCQASLRRVRWPEKGEPGLLLFSNPASPDRRINMTVRGSSDDGATWPLSLTLYPGSSAYSCLVALPNRSAGCLYEADDYQRIVFARFSLADFESSGRTDAGR